MGPMKSLLQNPCQSLCDWAPTGELIAGDLSDPLYEIEVELKEGDVRDLVELGHEMQEQLPVEPEELSKFARCLKLLAKQKPL